MERLTISLDDELAHALDALQDEATGSKANIVRRALRSYLKRHPSGERPTESDLRIWTDLLASRDHVILDVSHVRLIFGQCLDAPPTFWEELTEIGREHASQYKDKGVDRVEDVLRILESANWMYVSRESDRSWALVITEPTSKPFLKAFLTGWFSEIRPRVEIIDERTKMRVRIANATSPSPHH